MIDVQSIYIEDEFLFWTNSHLGNLTHGSVHKAFTEPFIEAVPLQSFYLESVENAMSVATNEFYVFFTGMQSGVDGGEGQNKRSVYGHLKQATRTTVVIGSMVNKVEDPIAMLAYRDTSILVANSGFISQLDLRFFPPTIDNFYDEPLVKTGVQTSYGMAFIATHEHLVTSKALLNAASLLFTYSAITTTLLLISVVA